MRHLTTFFIGLFLFALATDTVAQRRSRTSTREREEKPEKLAFKDKLTYGLFLGTTGFGNGFSISGKAEAGVKPFDAFDAFTAGVGSKFEFAFQNNFGNNNDRTIFNYGFYPFARFRITEEIYLKGEYNFFSTDIGPNFDRINFDFPMVGGGYVQGFDRWKVGFEVLILAGDSEIDNPIVTGATTSDLYTLIEYNIAFIYKL